MTYDDYLALGPEDRMRARLNDLALAAAWQEPVKAPDAETVLPLAKLKTQSRSVLVRKFKKRKLKTSLRDSKGRHREGTLRTDAGAGRVQTLVPLPKLEKISQEIGVDIATFERVIEAYEQFSSDKKK